MNMGADGSGIFQDWDSVQSRNLRQDRDSNWVLPHRKS